MGLGYGGFGRLSFVVSPSRRGCGDVPLKDRRA